MAGFTVAGIELVAQNKSEGRIDRVDHVSPDAPHRDTAPLDEEVTTDND